LGLPNLKLRGGSYHWRRKITVAGAAVPLSLSLGTGNYQRARCMADRLGATVESLRVAYGQSTGLTPDQLKRVFSDALRWQLQRIEQDQVGSPARSEDHATINSIYAEAWAFLGRNGVEARWTLNEHDRLVDAGWSEERAKAVADLVFDLQNGDPVSKAQLDSYSVAFGIASTRDNVARMVRTICSARASACREATARLPVGDDDMAQWIDEALVDDAPFAFEQAERAPIPVAQSTVKTYEPTTQGPVAIDEPPASSVPKRQKKRLLEAAEECITVYQTAGAWDTDSMKQVRTALRLFDYACGSKICIEDLEQSHVRDFTTLCRSLPNRWGRSREEQAGGIAASLVRAATMPPADIGISQTTINKHLTWVNAVLTHAAGEDDDPQTHRPAKPLSFKVARAGIGKTSRKAHKRDRDKRANWTKQEVAKLLSAPVWTGAAGIDRRLKPGTEIIHDAWYWMPLMLPLYGGRSSELAGLGLAEVHELEPIPYFRIDYTEDRALKNIQSIRRLPIHPELIRLGFIDYVTALRAAGCTLLFPEMKSSGSITFAGTFYKSIFRPLRQWAFPDGTSWRHRVGGALKDKDVHSFRGLATTLLKGRVASEVRCDLFGHEGETETARTYDEEAELSIKLEALQLLTPITAHIQPSHPINIRPVHRLRHGSRASTSRLNPTA
jgi:integrase